MFAWKVCEIGLTLIQRMSTACTDHCDRRTNFEERGAWEELRQLALVGDCPTLCTVTPLAVLVQIKMKLMTYTS
jgi:hypothetical protein